MHFVIDGDGVLWRGGQLLPHAKEFLNFLKKKGISYSFVSNNSSLRRKSLAQKFAQMKLPFLEEDIFTTNYLAGWYLEKKYKDELILVAGSDELYEEVRSRGLDAVRVQKLLSPEIEKAPGLTVKHYLKEALNVSPGVVLMGIDAGMNYARLSLIIRLVQDGATFIATNRDYAYPAEEGYFLPGNGAFVEIVEGITGRDAISLGKPERYLIELIEEERGVKRSEMVVVGDRLDTDIYLANRLGIKSVLVLTGVSGNELKGERKPLLAFSPTMIANDLGELINRFDELSEGSP